MIILVLSLLCALIGWKRILLAGLVLIVLDTAFWEAHSHYKLLYKWIFQSLSFLVKCVCMLTMFSLRLLLGGFAFFGREILKITGRNHGHRLLRS